MKDERAETSNKKKAPKKSAPRRAPKAASATARRTPRGPAASKKKSPVRTADDNPPTARDPRRPAAAKITEERRQAMVAERAYYKAERRGFVGGDRLQDWFEAEAEVDAPILRDAADDD